MGFFMYKENFKKNIPSIILFIFYVCFTLLMSFKHEIWNDEGQAWNIARDLTPSEIIEMMKYEGHSSLWSFILYPFAHSGLPVQVLGFISVFFMSIAVFLLIFKSPFPFYLKLFTVLSSGFIYINVTVSRVYCLIPVILFLIAIVYPKRFEKPIIYGVLIALLCNTHAMMCGVVGILGIYMLIDLFDNLRNPKFDKKYKSRQIIGLLTAGFGVIVFLLQIRNSAFSNETAFYAYGIRNIFSIFETMTITNYLFTGYTMALEDNMISNIILIIEVILYIITVICFFIILFLLRKHNRIISMVLFSLFFEIVVNCVLWYANPNRACIFVLTVLFFVWIAFSQNADKNINDEVLHKFKLTKFLLKLDKYKYKAIYLILAFINIFTIPVAIYYMYNDYRYQFNPSKQMADYIEENINTDDCLVISSAVCYAISSYNSDIKLLNFYSQEVGTISYHKVYDTTDIKIYSDDFYKRISEMLPDSQQAYYIGIVTIDQIPKNDNRINEIYRTEKGMPFPNVNGVYCLSLLEINLDEVRKQADITQ
jgi:hypothetical protein